MRVRTRAYLHHAFAHDPASEWEEDLFSVFNGGIEQARVGRVPRLVAKAVGATTTIVNVHRRVMQKIRGKHPDVDFVEFCAVATAFHEGEAARDSRKEVVFWFPSPRRKGRMLTAVIKATNHGTELWLQAVYPISASRVKKLQARAMVLRGKA